jgi:hypothetical protein
MIGVIGALTEALLDDGLRSLTPSLPGRCGPC